MSIKQNLLMTASGLLLIIIVGFMLSKLGKPYNTSFLIIHKLTALIITITSVLAIRKMLVDTSISSILIINIIIICLFIIILFASGAMMTIINSHHKLLKGLHIFSTGSLIISIVLLVSSLSIKR